MDESKRELIEITQLEISRAVLERGKRRWEFFWRGVKIAAPILDERFSDRFFAHEITIAPGDSLEVALRIVQEKKPDSGIYVNVRYEVVEVYQHVPRVDLEQTAAKNGLRLRPSSEGEGVWVLSDDDRKMFGDDTCAT